ncbi:MAG: hypothetical protein WA102_14055 [Candidatus Methanoperedens sp.]
MMSDKKTKNIDNKDVIEFLATSNSWINNGLITLVQRLQTDFKSQANIEFNHDKIKISSIGNQKLDELISNALNITAAEGTHNISASIKLLNQQFNSGYSFKTYPTSKEDFNEKIEITDEEKNFLKKQNKENTKELKIWKQRLSFLSDNQNYLKKGLNLKDDTKFIKAIFEEGNKKICPACGSKTGKLDDIQQQFNPLTSEHHNNKIEGFDFGSMGRKNFQICPKCILLCYFSTFNKNIPFFQESPKVTYLAIPNSVDLEILRKVNHNLSHPAQMIDLSKPTSFYYSSNIKSLFHRSKYACLLTLLHNIKNEYSKQEPDSLVMSFEEIPKEDFLEVIEWLFISKSFRINHIRADEKIYDILEKYKDPQNNDDVYLIPDFLNNFIFSEFDTNIIGQFFEGILKLESKKVSDGLFHMAKVSAGTPSKISQKSRPNGSSPLFLFEKVFLPKIMEVKTLLSNELSNACRDLAKSIGRGFSGDVGMMTKFAYASGTREFKMALEDAIFRLAKKSALDKNESNYVSEDNLKIIFDSLNAEQFSDIKNNFVSFMSVAAISRNYQNNKGGI